MPNQNQVTDKIVEPAFLNSRDAAKVIPIPLRTFLFYLQKGMIPSYKFGRNRLFKRSEVIAAVERHRVGSIDEVVAK